MLSAKDFQHQIEAILGSHFKFGKIEFGFQCHSKEEAQQHLIRVRQIQKQLRLVKKNVSATTKVTGSSYTAKKSRGWNWVWYGYIGRVIW